MRKFVALLAAAAFAAIPMSESFAARVIITTKPQPPAQSQGHHTTGPWAVACGIAAAGSLMIGTAVKANDPDESQRRQLTINEAGWLASACPFLLPWALMVQTTCPDNKATYQVARLAYRYLARHPAADQSAFTNAYREACLEGRLSRDTLRALRRLL
jgi:hypothetical protein